MSKYQILIEMPHDEDLSLLPPDAQYEIHMLQALYPNRFAPGTVTDLDRKLLYCVVTTESGDPLTLIEGMILAYELAWSVGGFQAAWSDDKLMDMDTDLVFPFLIQQYNYEYDGINEEPISSTPIPKSADALPKYQGLATWVA